MRKYLTFEVLQPSRLKLQWLAASRGLPFFAMLETRAETSYRENPMTFTDFECLMAWDVAEVFEHEIPGTFDALEQFVHSTRDWAFGFLSYELKDDVEKLSSQHVDNLGFKPALFVVPRLVCILMGRTLQVGFLPNFDSPESVTKTLEKWLETELRTDNNPKVGLHARMDKASYIAVVEQLKSHIRRGDIYEANFCQEFYGVKKGIDGAAVYSDLRRSSPSPFGAYFKYGGHEVISASPERFLKRRGNRLVSQPMKGTAARQTSPEEDAQTIANLAHNPKERAENVMITDLVRNDLARVAERGSVQVDELCGVYPFRHVFQMISTVSASVRPETGLAAILKASFPMGSMTGAPKKRAMELIEQYELSRRGIYSGALGYFAPNGDFDFSVVIRTLCYNSASGYLSLQVGSAITDQAQAESEWQECLLKANALLQVLNGNIDS